MSLKGADGDNSAGEVGPPDPGWAFELPDGTDR